MKAKTEKRPISISRFFWRLMSGLSLVTCLLAALYVGQSGIIRLILDSRLKGIPARLQESAGGIDRVLSRQETLLGGFAMSLSAGFSRSAYRADPGGYLAEFYAANEKSLRRLLRGMQGASSVYAAVEALPAVRDNGFRLGAEGGARRLPYALDGSKAQGDTAGLRLSRAMGSGGPVWADADSVASVSCSVPLADDAGPFGAIAFELDGGSILGGIGSASFAKGGWLSVSDGEGTLLGHSPSGLSDLDVRRLGLLCGTGSAPSAGSGGGSLRSLSLNGKAYYCASVTLLNGWTLLGFAPRSEILAPLCRNGAILFGLSLTCALIAALSSFLIARFVSKPLERLTSEALVAFSGETRSLLEERGPQEVRILAKALNKSFSETRKKTSQQQLLMDSDTRIDLLTMDLQRERLQSLNGFKLFGLESASERDEMDFHEWTEHFHVRMLERDFNPLLSSGIQERRDQEAVSLEMIQGLRDVRTGHTVQREIAFDTLKGEERFMRVNVVRVSRDTLLAACVDMTDEYHTRRDLFVLSTRLSYALNATQSVAIFDISTETMELWASDSFFPIFEIDMPPTGMLILPDFEKRLAEGDPPLLDREQGPLPSDFWRKGVRVFKLNLPRSRSVRWVEVRAAETVRGVIGTVIDITREVLEKQAALEKADSAQELSRVILSALTEAVVGMGKDGRCIFMNPAAETLLGYSPQELVGRELEPIFTMVNVDGVPTDGGRSLLEITLRGHQAFSSEHGRFRRKDGSLFQAAFRAQPLFKGADFVGAVATLVDVSGLVELSNRFSAILANAVDQLYIKDQDLRMTMVSDSILKGLGLADRSDILGKTALEYLPPEIAFEYYSAEKGVLESGKPLRDLVLKFPGPEEARWLNVSIIPIRDERAEIIGVFGIARDITDAYRLDDELRAAKETADRANQAKSIFLAGMSHEIRTPLNAILGYSQLMEGDAGLSQDQRRKVETIMRSGEHLLDLINSILEISKIEAGRVRPFLAATDLFRLTSDIEEMFRVRTEAKGLVFDVRRDPSAPQWILTDIQKLRQILINLLGNAVKFTDKGGVSMRVGLSGDKLAFEVRDSGPGISEDEKARLFHPFEQGSAGVKSQGGTGLGLAISREYAELLGGGISVEDATEGQGSLFLCRIALIEAQAAQGLALPSGATISGFEEKGASPLALDVDDSESNRLLVKDILSPVGFRVLDAVNGLEAIRVAGEANPDVILMDIAMPVMDGLEAISRIRSGTSNPGVPIIAVTASAFEEDRRKIMAAGANDFIRKPIDRTDLLEKIGRALGLKYRYNESVRSGDMGIADESGPADLGAIPEELQRELRKAAVELAPFQAEDVVKAIGRIDSSLAAKLAKMLARFDFQSIVALLDGKEKNNGK